MEIEEVAANHPERILRAAVDPAAGISGFHCRKLGFGLGLVRGHLDDEGVAAGLRLHGARRVRGGAGPGRHKNRA
jgi:hypothetical protein